MLNKTTNYDQFVLRSDNRERLCQNHIERLKASIRARNLLEMRPIIVNESLEVLDGQHRLEAAKALGVEIYYLIEKQLKAEDIITLNVAKSWGMADYLNFYCKNGHKEYQKLNAFMDAQGISLKIAIHLANGRSHKGYHDFKAGKFLFDEDLSSQCFDVCWQSIDTIKKINGVSHYAHSARFWQALILLTTHPDFDPTKWDKNLQMMANRIGAKATMQDYLKLFENIYNWHNVNKLSLNEE